MCNQPQQPMEVAGVKQMHVTASYKSTFHIHFINIMTISLLIFFFSKSSKQRVGHCQVLFMDNTDYMHLYRSYCTPTSQNSTMRVLDSILSYQVTYYSYIDTFIILVLSLATWCNLVASRDGYNVYTYERLSTHSIKYWYNAVALSRRNRT